MRGFNEDFFLQIGLVTLIALSASNGILIVEFAQRFPRQGVSVRDAAHEAARQQFRPIAMTSAAFMLGVLPLTFATGARANARRAIGTGIIGNLLTATFFTMQFVPVFYVWIEGSKADRIQHGAERCHRAKGRIVVSAAVCEEISPTTNAQYYPCYTIRSRGL